MCSPKFKKVNKTANIICRSEPPWPLPWSETPGNVWFAAPTHQTPKPPADTSWHPLKPAELYQPIKNPNQSQHSNQLKPPDLWPAPTSSVKKTACFFVARRWRCGTATSFIFGLHSMWAFTCVQNLATILSCWGDQMGFWAPSSKVPLPWRGVKRKQFGKGKFQINFVVGVYSLMVVSKMCGSSESLVLCKWPLTLQFLFRPLFHLHKFFSQLLCDLPLPWIRLSSIISVQTLMDSLRLKKGTNWWFATVTAIGTVGTDGATAQFVAPPAKAEGSSRLGQALTRCSSAPLLKHLVSEDVANRV